MVLQILHITFLLIQVTSGHIASLNPKETHDDYSNGLPQLAMEELKQTFSMISGTYSDQR